LNTIQFAQKKAKYAAIYGRPSKVAEDTLKGGNLAVLVFPDGFPNQGGLPIKIDDKVIGELRAAGRPARWMKPSRRWRSMRC